jgi:hypothetical protein
LFQKRVSYSTTEQHALESAATEIAETLKPWYDEADDFVSLGQNCNASWYLKAAGRKDASYPFDWVFTSPEIIMHILKDDFQQFTDPSLLVPIGMDAGHRTYHAFLFGHRNPASSSADLAFLHRCIERWHALIQSDHHVVFLTVVLNEHNKRKRFANGFQNQFKLPIDQKPTDFKPMMDLIRTRHPKAKFLFVEQYTDAIPELKLVDHSKEMAWIRFASKGSNTGVRYLNEFDDTLFKILLGAKL